MELLSPAGTLESGVTALKYGADAVYLGMQDYSARADAGNFTFEDLSTLLGIAHHDSERPRKVYVAVNTLVRESELSELVSFLARLRDLEVDALIIQDWAVYQLAREKFPEFELHASTQLAVHNIAGARRARELGFSRIVCARELTMPEIERISAIDGLETEVFIHGALCYSYSGLCLLSAALRGTSGNRGSCEYICRGNYAVRNGDRPPVSANVMSMKDLAAGDLIGALRNAGVASLKIEGRKKTPLYVSAVTNYYRKLIDGTFAPGEQARAEADIRTIFSRPWTPFHLKRRNQVGITDIHTVGHRGVEAGIVTTVVTGNGPDRLRFNVRNQPLEKHDGLQIELGDRDKPFGFPVNDLRVFPQRNNDTWKSAFEAPVDATIEVTLPEEHPEIPAGARIFCSSSQAVKRSYDWEMPRPALVKARFPVYFTVKVQPDRLTVVSQPNAGPRELDGIVTELPLEAPLSAAKQPEKVADSIRGSFAKLGDTDYTMADIRIENPGQLYVPVSFLNELRRRAAEDIRDALAQDLDELSATVRGDVSRWKPSQEGAHAGWTLKIDHPFFLNLFKEQDLAEVDDVILSLSRTPEDELDDAVRALRGIVGQGRIRIGLPAVFRGDKGYATLDGIRHLLNLGCRKWEIANIGSLDILKEAGADMDRLDITADWTLFVTNRYAAKSLLEQGCRRLTLSPDDTWDNWCALVRALGPLADVPVYQDTMLAISDVCANSSLNEYCPGKNSCTFTSMKLANPRKDEYLIALNNNCQTVVINEKPLDLSGHIHALKNEGARRLRAEFCWQNYAPTKVLDIWRNLRADKENRDAWTANLFR